MKILIAEDNAFSRTLLKKTLTKVGYEVVAVDNGNAAWEELQREDPPKLALVDWMMPGLSGIDLCRKIREIKTTIPVYMILLTAKTDKDDVLEGFSAGADDFIKKPFDSGELLARIKVGRRLVEQQALLHCLIDSIPDPIYVKDSRGLYLGCNSAYARFVGVEQSAVNGRSASEILEPELARQSHMEDLRVLANADTLESEGWEASASDGDVYLNTLKVPYLESSGGSTGMIGISRNLTRRMEMEQEMRRLAVAVEQSTESIMITDDSGVIQYVNKAFEVNSGYLADEVIEKHLDILKGKQQNSDVFEKLWATISSGETWAGQLTNCRKDGNIYEEEAVIYPIFNDAATLVNYVCISRDITQEMAIEKHLRQQLKMNAVGELAGGISHDFNNILTAILGYVALCMNVIDEESRAYGYLKEIVKAGDRATKLVRQILTFSRQEEQAFKSVYLQPIIEDSISMVRTTLKKSVQVELDIDPDCGAVLGDPTQLQQVMINLCTNAGHALGKEALGTLSVSLKQVEFLAGGQEEQAVNLDPGRYVCITVQDSGCGMPPEVQERIFEPYYTTKKKGEGTGFGLSIVHGIVRKHRGTISVESEEGTGTVFNLYFPLSVEAAEKDTGDESLLAPKGRGRILFVDDDDAVLAMGCELLESFGYVVITATNGRGALDVFEQDPDGFDALVTDYSMPDMNGYELIRQVLEIRKELVIVLCSGYVENVEGEDFKELEHTIFMAKPVDWHQLSQKIQAGN